VRPAAWTRSDLLVAGGAAVGVAATAETVRAVHARFTADLGGLSLLERAAVALWDFGPLSAAVFAAGALAVLAGLAAGPPPRLAALLEPALVLLLSAYATLGLVVVALAGWVGAAGRIGEADGLAIRYDDGERAVTVTTQVLGWGSLVALFGFLVLRTPPEPAAPPPSASLFDEMDALWRERIAFTPNRERGRTLLHRIRYLEEQGDLDGARELADELRRLKAAPRPSLAARACLALTASQSSMRCSGSSGWRPVCSRRRSMR
jgi:hypothetical protein